MSEDALVISRRIIAHHSRSFALASRLLPAAVRDRAVVVYAWCRRADDAVDLAPADTVADALASLQDELGVIYGTGPLPDPILQAFRQVTRTCQIPRHYPQELLEGLAMDARGTDYDNMSRLLEYCYRVAGTVGLMMCHVMGIRDEQATTNAAHLGVAMQITNICRDVEEDWRRGRMYIPAEVLRRHGTGRLQPEAGQPFPEAVGPAVAQAIGELLEVADAYYRSGDAGIPALSWRCGLAVRTARNVYSAIGARIRAQRCDPTAGRAWVSGPAKLRLVAQAIVRSMDRDQRVAASTPLRSPSMIVRAQDILPLTSDTPPRGEDTQAKPGSDRRPMATRTPQGSV